MAETMPETTPDTVPKVQAPHDAARDWAALLGAPVDPQSLPHAMDEVPDGQFERVLQRLAPKADESLVADRDAVIARLLTAGFVEVQAVSEHLRKFVLGTHVALVPKADPDEDGYFRQALDFAGKECAKAEARTLATAIAARNPRPEPSVVPASVDDAGLSGRWGHQHSAPIPDGLAGLGARGQEPVAPVPTLAEVQAERDYERRRANEAIAQLHDAQRELAALRVRVADGGKVVKG